MGILNRITNAMPILRSQPSSAFAANVRSLRTSSPCSHCPVAPRRALIPSGIAGLLASKRAASRRLLPAIHAAWPAAFCHSGGRVVRDHACALNIGLSTVRVAVPNAACIPVNHAMAPQQLPQPSMLTSCAACSTNSSGIFRLFGGLCSVCAWPTPLHPS